MPIVMFLLTLWLGLVIGGVFHVRDPHPTADERYGCTLAQQAPNGDCP